jgi:crotonobetainyl-CoA:carnitine CoA-transferase CaiB-like acyl-CoA transferase
MVAVGNNKQFVGFCNAIGVPSLSKDVKFSTNEARVQNRKELIALIQSIMASRPLKDWESAFEGLGFPFGAVRSIKESFDDAQALHRGMRVAVNHPRCGPVDVVGPPVKYSRTPCEVRMAPPLLGQHTKEVLKERLSLADSEIERLVRSGAIECQEL